MTPEEAERKVFNTWLKGIRLEQYQRHLDELKELERQQEKRMMCLKTGHCHCEGPCCYCGEETPYPQRKRL